MIQFLVSNWGTLVGILSAVLALASLVTRLTATPKDDEIVLKLIGILSFLHPGDVGGLKVPGMPVATAPKLPESPVTLVRRDNADL